MHILDGDYIRIGTRWYCTHTDPCKVCVLHKDASSWTYNRVNCVVPCVDTVKCWACPIKDENQVGIVPNRGRCAGPDNARGCPGLHVTTRCGRCSSGWVRGSDGEWRHPKCHEAYARMNACQACKRALSQRWICHFCTKPFCDTCNTRNVTQGNTWGHPGSVFRNIVTACSACDRHRQTLSRSLPQLISEPPQALEQDEGVFELSLSPGLCDPIDVGQSKNNGPGASV